MTYTEELREQIKLEMDDKIEEKESDLYGLRKLQNGYQKALDDVLLFIRALRISEWFDIGYADRQIGKQEALEMIDKKIEELR